MVDYTCFLKKYINYWNVMSIQKFCFLQALARFLQVRKILQHSCKNLARMPLHPRILQKLNFLKESCKISQEINFLSTRVSLNVFFGVCGGTDHFSGYRFLLLKSCSFGRFQKLYIVFPDRMYKFY